MQAITTIGLDIAKSVFQVHGVDADGRVLSSCLVVELIPFLGVSDI
jgi:transposase